MNELNSSQQGKLLPSSFPLTTTLSFFLQLNNQVCFCVLFCGIGRWRFYICGDTDLLQFEVRFPLYLVSVPSRHGRQPRVEWKFGVSGSFPAGWCEVCLSLCDLMDYTVHGILQARILEWVAFPFSSGSSQPRNWTRVSCFAGRFFTSWATRESREVDKSKLLVTSCKAV